MRGGHNRKTRQHKALVGTLQPYRERGKVIPLRRGKRGAVRPPLWLKPVAVAKWEELAQKLHHTRDHSRECGNVVRAQTQARSGFQTGWEGSE